MNRCPATLSHQKAPGFLAPLRRKGTNHIVLETFGLGAVWTTTRRRQRAEAEVIQLLRASSTTLPPFA